jgi:RHS repeat-associated protein
LHYRSGGAGGEDFPGTPAWRTTLGLYWSHTHAERIVVWPDVNTVSLITEGGSFRQFTGLAGGGGLRLYAPSQNAPSDEYRQLYYDTATGGWQLDHLDGTRDYFLASGLWDKTTSALDPLHPTQGIYTSGKLSSVAFPDGRTETYTYHPSGKLASITEVGIGGSPTRTWTYTWSGEELTLISRPDGTQWELTYDPAKNGNRAGYLTQVRLIGTDLTGRIAGGYEYDAVGRIIRAWEGDPSYTGPLAVNRQEFAYTGSPRPTQTVITRKVTGSFDEVSTLALARDTRSVKAKVTSIAGSCPTCSLAPGSTFTYGNASHPLRPTVLTDGRGTQTGFIYNANGRLTSKTEASNVPSLSRLTSYTYDGTFPALVTRVEVPSTSGGSNKRGTDSVYDGTTSFMTTRSIDGYEGGPADNTALPAGYKVTSYTPNGSGEVASVDPPGFGTADVTSFTYDLPDRNGHVVHTRVDPLVGTTTYAYDGLNRRTSVIDANGVETVTTYDCAPAPPTPPATCGLYRVTEVRRKGATPAADLVATYTYNVFGDLYCVKQPEGNAREQLYDSAGRLTEIRRGTGVPNPSASSCLQTAYPTYPRERTVYQLDGAGHRIEESQEAWNGTAWVSASRTAYTYTCRLDKVTRGAGSATPSVTENCYDQNDNLTQVWDPNHPKGSNPNPTQSYTYDALNRLTALVVGPGTANAATTAYEYDVQDHLRTVTDAELNQTTYKTSDRDLLTRELSPVTGTTIHTYDEHRNLATTKDAREVVTTRTIDAADRPTSVTFGPAGTPDPTLTTTYAYGSTQLAFDVGRLTGITRNGQTLAYTYDRFGRMLQDGSLTYGYDKNGNRTTLDYPGTVSATTTYDFADRPVGLTYDAGAGSQPLVTSATYLPSGPLATLALANGITETRDFDARYYPDRIRADAVAGSVVDWDYTVDAVGNPTSISGSILASAYGATFGYLDGQYFLTQGDGPWGTRGWTYDKIGNRLSVSQASEPTQTYSYIAHNPRLATISPSPGVGSGTWTFDYDNAGNQTLVVESSNEGVSQTTFHDIAADNRMSALRTSDGPSRTDFLYDGRGYLREADLTVTASGDGIQVTPTYSSSGQLMAREEQRSFTTADVGPDGEDLGVMALSQETTQILYFAGRPVAQLTNGELLTLTTDHLGTPILAVDSAGTPVWGGGVEPFGRTWTAGVDNPDPELAIGRRQGLGLRGRERRGEAGVGPGGGVAESASGAAGSGAAAAYGQLSSERVFLRYPGQWASDAFRVTSTQGDLYYNLHRWYDLLIGAYSTPDPLGLHLRGALTPVNHLFSYSKQRPSVATDPLGLLATEGCIGMQVERLELAADMVRRAVWGTGRKGSCLDCFRDQSAVIRALNTTTFHCLDRGIQALNAVPDICAFAAKPDYSTVTGTDVTILDRSFTGTATNDCGCLAGTMLHELLHTTICASDHDCVRNISLRCLPCAALYTYGY